MDGCVCICVCVFFVARFSVVKAEQEINKNCSIFYIKCVKNGQYINIPTNKQQNRWDEIGTIYATTSENELIYRFYLEK